MFTTTALLRGTLAASALLSLAAAVATPASSNTDFPGTRAQIKLNNHLKCVTSFTTWDRPASDTCIPVKGLNYQSLEVIKPWPICDNGTEAQFAEFDTSSGTCDPELNRFGKMNPLLSKKDVLFGCKDVRNIGSFAFWCDGVPRPLVKEPQSGGLIKYPKERCDKKLNLEPLLYEPDTCIDITEGMGLSFTRPGVCKNGTNAIIGGFKGKGCDPTSKPLKDPFTAWDDRVVGFCVPTDEINSMIFWCDGLEGLDMSKPYSGPPSHKKGSNMGMILGLTIGLGLPFMLAIALFVTYNINYHFREKVKELFGTGDGYIAL